MDPESMGELNHDVRDLNYLNRNLDKTAEKHMNTIGQLRMDPESMGELNHDVRDLNYLNRNLDKTAEKHMNTIGQLTTAYIFCGSLFLHVIVQPSFGLNKRFWWLPFCIFLMVALIFWLTLSRILLRLFQVRDEYYLTLKILQISRVRNVSGGPNWQEMQPRKTTFFTRLKQNASLLLVLSALLAFTVLILCACFLILRDDQSLTDTKRK